MPPLWPTELYLGFRKNFGYWLKSVGEGGNTWVKFPYYQYECRLALTQTYNNSGIQEFSHLDILPTKHWHLTHVTMLIPAGTRFFVTFIENQRFTYNHIGFQPRRGPPGWRGHRTRRWPNYMVWLGDWGCTSQRSPVAAEPWSLRGLMPPPLRCLQIGSR